MKLLKVTKSLILEASAKDVMIHKIGLTDKVADFFVERCGKLAIIIVNKIIQYNLTIMDIEGTPSKTDIQKATHWVNINYRTFSEDLVSIMDWVRVGLNGNLGSHKNDDFQTLIKESKKWHDELEVGSGIYNYEENEDNVVIDFRDKNGIGFYWVDLMTTRCTDEQKRMGHCASTGGDTLYSLRETRRINDKFTINKSHLTAAMEEKDDGFIILQLKGQKNSKPAEKYHKYIVELLTKPIISIVGFGSEYDSASDFKLSDLNDNLLNAVLTKNQKLFGNIALYSAYKKGLIDKEPQTIFDIKITADDMNFFINSNSYDSVKKSKSGRFETTYFVENFLENGLDIFDADISWRDFTYYSSNNLEKKIEQYLITNFENEIKDLNLEHNDDDYFDDLNLIEKIEHLDIDYELIDVIRYALSNAYESSYHNVVYNSIKDALSDYGEVLSLNYEGAVVRVNIMNYKDDIDSSKIFTTAEEVADELRELIYEQEIIEKSKLSINDRYISIDSDSFEQNFYALCLDYNIPIKK